MKIDIYAHACPQKVRSYVSEQIPNWGKFVRTDPGPGLNMLWDIDKRLEMMGKYEDYVQVLVPTVPTAVISLNSRDTANLARMVNDGMAELVSKYPDKFVAAVAYLPLNNIDAALKEIDRAIDELGFKGIFLYTPIYEAKKPAGLDYDYNTMKPIDSPELMPIYESMSRHKLPIWIHPRGASGVPVYKGEKRGKYGLSHVFGWPIESAMAMGRLVCSGIMAKYPNLRFITHHCGGGIVPALVGRLDNSFDSLKFGGMKWGQADGEDPFGVKRPVDYFRMFYADTALYGDTAGLMCGHAFFGVDHMLFGTDYPWDIEEGDKYIRLTINAVNRMNIPDADKEKIFEGNARQILRLDNF